MARTIVNCSLLIANFLRRLAKDMVNSLGKNSLLILGIFILFTAHVFAQAEEPVLPDQPQKFALVIGNGNYADLSPLANPVNDANDIAAVLEYLGFTVDKVINGSLEQMEDAVMRLRDNLSGAEKGYGFFFYAGHGVQSGGETGIIPVANYQGKLLGFIPGHGVFLLGKKH